MNSFDHEKIERLILMITVPPQSEEDEKRAFK